MKNKNNTIKQKEAISLIVLIITIIVIIILAGSVILSLVDNNPISQAEESRFKLNLDSYNSELGMQLANMYLADTTFDSATFDAGIWDGSDDNITGTIKQYIKSITPADGQKLKIENGKLVYVGTEESEILWANNLLGGDDEGGSGGCTSGHTWVDANYLYAKTCSVCGETEGVPLDIATATKHPSQVNSTFVTIGADGQVANLDLWDYDIITADGWYCDYTTPGTYGLFNYLGTIIDGKIDGYIPQIIDGIEVTLMEWTFWDQRASLTTAPLIPSSMQSINGIFEGCTLLTIPPKLPEGIRFLEYTFSDTRITVAPEIPSSVIGMQGTFGYCESLRTPPEIPDGVLNMEDTFEDCINLETAPILPDSVTNLAGTFVNCIKLEEAPVIPNGALYIDGMFCDCTSLEAAPIIPSSVISMIETFCDCPNLTGIVQVNAFDINSVVNCFSGLTKNITLRVKDGTTTNTIFTNSYGSNPLITFERY